MNSRHSNRPDPAPPAADSRGSRVALLFALVAQRLTAFYEHGQQFTVAQGATLAADWLARSGRSLPLEQRRQLSELSEAMARRMLATLSREAGLFTAHEMTEALDPNYDSELARTLMVECERLLDAD
ncbi:hypothetical protein [Azonexus fungiphilus]|uniref:hypothetical protein n=1 Tax=Azonexus fungiphilus TaxID=146940 RepID=UPI00156AC3A2|nr:hypothetical protein [Azonexus fungiphilus]NHC08529.1 hypothetical protein [Azonexus fungiphilus]